MSSTLQADVVPITSIRIAAGFNARAIDTDGDEFKGLTASIRALGVIQPLIVVPNSESGGPALQLVAGHRRLLAAAIVGLDSVPVVMRDAEHAEVDAAVENMSREQLWPLEEATAIKAVIDKGYTVDGVAEVLGVAKRTVTARLELFDLPEYARSMFGPREGGHYPLGTLPILRTIALMSGPLCDAVVRYLEEHEHPSRLLNNPGWIIGKAITATKGMWGEYLVTYSLDDLRDGKGKKRHVELMKQIEKGRSAYDYLPNPRFSTEDVDQARAAGVLLEISEDANPIILDKKMYGVIVDGLLDRELPRMLASSGRGKTEAAKTNADGTKRELTEAEVAEREFRTTQRGWQTSGRAVNLELGAALINELSEVKVDMDVARFFVAGLLGTEGTFRDDGKVQSGYGSSDAANLAVAGMRLCIDELRHVEVPKLKSGKDGKAKITYATAKDCEAWLWRYIDGAKTPEQLFGRALVVYAASHYAVQHAVPSSQRGGRCVPSARKSQTTKALEKLAAKHVPVSVKKLRKAIAAAYKDQGQGAPWSV